MSLLAVILQLAIIEGAEKKNQLLIFIYTYLLLFLDLMKKAFSQIACQFH